MRRLLGASCLAIILIGSYSLKQTFDGMRWNKWMADQNEEYTKLLLAAPRCITTGHWIDENTFMLAEGVCQLSPADVGDVMEIFGEGPEKTIVLRYPQ